MVNCQVGYFKVISSFDGGNLAKQNGTAVLCSGDRSCGKETPVASGYLRSHTGGHYPSWAQTLVFFLFFYFLALSLLETTAAGQEDDTDLSLNSVLSLKDTSTTAKMITMLILTN